MYMLHPYHPLLPVNVPDMSYLCLVVLYAVIDCCVNSSDILQLLEPAKVLYYYKKDGYAETFAFIYANYS